MRTSGLGCPPSRVQLLKCRAPLAVGGVGWDGGGAGLEAGLSEDLCPSRAVTLATSLVRGSVS